MGSSTLRRLGAGMALSTLLAGTVVSGAHASGDNGERGLERRAEQARDEGDFVSVGTALRHGGEHTEVAAGTGDLRTGTPVPKDAQFRIASATKTFIATVTLQLVGEGKLSLDDSVERWLPGVVAGNGNDGSKVTLRNLLQNTSGLANYTNYLNMDTAEDFERDRYRHWPAEELVELAMEHKPNFPPADKDDPEPDWDYSNTNFVLAGMVIKAATGNDWRTEVTQRVLDPLELTDTYAPGRDPLIRGPHARTYIKYPDRQSLTDTTERSLSWGDAAGELISTHRDLNRFFTALLAGELLDPEELRQMRQTVPMSEEYQEIWPGVRYGLALLEQPLPCDESRWGHAGDIDGSSVRTGFTEDGRVGITAVTSGGENDHESIVRSEMAMGKLIEGAMCAVPGSTAEKAEKATE